MLALQARYDRYDDGEITTTYNPEDCEPDKPKGKKVLEYFTNLTKEKGIRGLVFIVCSKIARKIISDATQTPDDEAHTLLMTASILRKAVLDLDTAFKFGGSFPNCCEESSVPKRMKYFFRQLIRGYKSSPEQANSRKILS